MGERGSGWVMFPPPRGGQCAAHTPCVRSSAEPDSASGKNAGIWLLVGERLQLLPGRAGPGATVQMGLRGAAVGIAPPREGVLGGWGGRRSWCVWSRAPRPGANVQKSKAKPQCLAQALPVDAEGAAKGTKPWRGLCLGQRLLARTLAVDPYPPPPGS